MTLKIEKIKSCRVCGSSDLKLELFLGSLYPSTFLTSKSKSGLTSAPLNLVTCECCGLVQLQHTVELDHMYKQYWYRSGLNKSMVKDLEDVYNKSMNKLDMDDVNVHVDIGCNDGTLSTFFVDDGIISIGFDPANNLKESAEKNCSFFINDYFSADVYGPLRKRADIITAIAMFYDLPDPGKFVEDIKKVLADDGIFVVQLTDLYSMLKINAFDNICHEHLEYYTLNWLVEFFKEHDMTVFDSEYNKVNGGSLRIYVCKQGKRKPTIRRLFHQIREAIYLAKHEDWGDKLTKEIITIGTKVKTFLSTAKNPYGLGASTKGNTLLQALKIDSTTLKGIGEVNKDKFGLYTVGTGIKILSEEQVIKKNPDVCLVLPWHFESTFIKNLDAYLENGGKLLFPMPEPRIVYKENGKVKTKYL